MASPAVPILIGGLFAWSIYRRVRRNIGRQQLKPLRTILSIVILVAITAFIFSLASHDLNLSLGIGGGLLAGGLLGIVGLRLTKFETTEAGHFYTPNMHIGIALSVLFIGRMAYKFIMADPTLSRQPSPLPLQSPLTLLILGLTVGYYLVYQAGVLVHTRDKTPSDRPTSTSDQE